jgi:hypothetical protein
MDELESQYTHQEHDEAYFAELSIIEVESCRLVANAAMHFEIDLYHSFQDYIGRFVSMAKLDDNMRAVQNVRQQDSEAKRNALEAEKLQRIEKLTNHQKERRDEAQSIVKENEILLNGLKNVLQSQADSQRSLLQEKLRARKAKRMKELQAKGMSHEEADEVATEEYKGNDDMLTKELEKTLQSEQTMQLKMKDEDTKELKSMKNEKNAITKNIASGEPLDAKFMSKANDILQGETDSDLERIKRLYKKKQEQIMANAPEGESENELAKLNEDMNKDIAAIKRRHDNAMDILTQGHTNARSNQMKRLESRLAAERAKKK